VAGGNLKGSISDPNKNILFYLFMSRRESKKKLWMSKNK
jgi:hypothetical protein